MTSRFHQLREARPLVLPSLLQCDFGNLEREIRALEQAGVRGLHLDVMDGNFVPNLTYGMPIVEGLRRLTELPLDVHLMMANPDDYLESFRDAGSDLLTIHVEAVSDAAGTLSRIKDLGVGAGIAINPSTPIDQLEPCLELADLILVMSVEAGFGGQAFNPSAHERLAWVRERKRDEQLLEVDGGISTATIGPCQEAGGELFVVGSAIFKETDYAPIVKTLTECIQGALS